MYKIYLSWPNPPTCTDCPPIHKHRAWQCFKSDFETDIQQHADMRCSIIDACCLHNCNSPDTTTSMCEHAAICRGKHRQKSVDKRVTDLNSKLGADDATVGTEPLDESSPVLLQLHLLVAAHSHIASGRSRAITLSGNVSATLPEVNSLVDR